MLTFPRLLETAPDDRLTSAASSVVEVLRSAPAEALQRARPVVVTLGPTGTFAVRIESDDSLLTLTSGVLKLPEGITLGLPDALTGHLVLSTLHTNDAAGAITRLIDLGVAPYLVASTLEGVLAQRLVRVLCPSCRMEVEPSVEQRAMLSDGPVWRAAGCPLCRGTGFRGRTGIYEMLVLEDEIRRMVVDHHPAGEIRKRACGFGMTTLREDGLRLVRQGLTALEEVLRVTGAGSGSGSAPN